MAVKKYMDHNLYSKALVNLSKAALRYSLKDAREARDAMPEGINNGFYADEVHYIAAELRRRDTV
jgi:hypothetical protein